MVAPPWARNDIWRRARAVPTLDLDFANTKSVGPLVTFTRASSATYVGSDGVLQTAATNEARFDHNPTTGESLGLLVEEQRTNLLLQSATLSTQSVTVTAAAHTLSFTGTGTVTLSGTSTAGPLVGTGTGLANRVSLIFTPTAGTLTLTVSGTVSNAQLELGAFPTSYIPTTTAAATRSADVASITGANFSSWFNSSAMTIYSEAASTAGAAYSGHVYGIGAAFNDSIQHYRQADFQPVARVRTAGVDEYGAIGNGTIWTGTSSNRFALALSSSSGRQASNGSLATGGDDTSITLPAMSSMVIGAAPGGGSPINGTIRRLTYWPQRLPNSTLQAITQ
jgi:hypothetical protein